MQASHAEKTKGEFFQRFSLQFRIQHFVLFLSYGGAALVHQAAGVRVVVRKRDGSNGLY